MQEEMMSPKVPGMRCANPMFKPPPMRLLAAALVLSLLQAGTLPASAATLRGANTAQPPTLPAAAAVCPAGMGFGEVVECSISAPGEIDIYTFSANAGDKVLARMSETSDNFWPKISIHSPGGTKLCEAFGTTSTEIASCDLPSTGTYTLQAVDYFGTYSADYHLYLQRLNNPGSALAVSFGQTVTAVIVTPVKMDTYTFSANAGDKVLVRMSESDPSFWPKIRIYSPGGAKLCETFNTESTEIASCDLPDAGTYTLLALDNFGLYTAGYNLYLQRLNNPGDPLAVSFGQTVTAASITPVEMDTFTFSAEAGDKVLVRMSETDPSFWPKVRIYSPGGTLLCETFSTESTEIASCDLPDAGTYTLLALDNFGLYTAGYHLYLQRLNNPGDPTPVTICQSTSASILLPTEMDTYTFSAEAGDKVLVRMSESDPYFWPKIRLYSPAGLKLCEAFSTDTTEISSCELPVTGTYSLLALDVFGLYASDYQLFLGCRMVFLPVIVR
jgi:hypothetical protein